MGPREDEEKHHRTAAVTVRFGTYRISSINAAVTIIFSMQCLGVTVQGRRLLEGGSNKKLKLGFRDASIEGQHLIKVIRYSV